MFSSCIMRCEICGTARSDHIRIQLKAKQIDVRLYPRLHGPRENPGSVDIFAKEVCCMPDMYHSGDLP
jgi:hypothetical protein